MPKLAFALLLTTLLCLFLNVLPAQADDPPTQAHQQLFQVNYIPSNFGPIAGSGQPLVQVAINGKQIATFLVDTGTSNSVVSTEFAKQINLPLKPAVGSADGLPIMWEGKQAMETSVSTLRIGSSFQFTDMPLIVLDADQISMAPDERHVNPYQGILGSSVMQQYAILVDGPTHIFGLCLPGNLSQEQIRQIGFTHPYILPLTSVNHFQWYVQAQFVNGTHKGNENLLVDTGSDITNISENLAEKLDMKVLGEKKSKTAHGLVVSATTVADELSLGDLTMRTFPLVIRPSLQRLPPSLGMDILSGYRVLMDFPGGKMYLQPNAAAAITVGPAPAATAPPAK